ncbi:glucose 1-dehydrogenase [Undibacterium sp. Di27W]|uniref:glucose 1-dehydrogenase n=1 Tax=Undibacterium sp. Di27W TaxID=3413036 RepID=UPI003BF04400
MNIRLDGKVALVTGGSGGIGQAIARSLAASGAAVGVNYIGTRASADATVNGITDAGGKAIALEADIADMAAVQAMFAQLDTTLGSPDILINCAGIDGHGALSWDIDPVAWRRVIEVNLFGSFYCSRQALQRMVPRKSGVILNISSVHETIAWTGYSAYTSSKAALSMLTKTMAQEAAPFGIRVLAVAPGAIQTDINKSVWSDPEQMRDLAEKIPLGRMGQVQEIAGLVTFLVSDGGSYVTGTTVFADGGMTDYPDFSHGG